jgi:Histidine kinase-, DNA gyrase B-, and HSP90-like ATPase
MTSNTDLRPPFIGSYVLETLTTGMYGESRNALREYVQNSFDAIRSAIGAGLITADIGRIDVLLPDKDTLIISDNGVGIGSGSAWGTLTAIGASKKDRRVDAGFRGIGRLAGIAFCDTLTFKTKAAGERTETVVTFDCKALRGGMSPEGGGEELVELLQRAVSASTTNGLKTSGHYMVVTLKGLGSAPTDFKNLDNVRNYLAETSPLSFDPDWELGEKITAAAKESNQRLETVALNVGQTPETVKALYKRYRSSYATSEGPANIAGLEFYSDEDGQWWGWVGVPDKPAILKDKLTHGLRVRVKNIQIGGTEIFDRLFARKNESYARFNSYYIGEIHSQPDLLVPNARRDGFEENDAWHKVQASLFRRICGPLTRRAYQLSKGRQSQLEAIQKRMDDFAGVADQLLKADHPDEDQKFEVLHKAKRIRVLIANALKEAEPETKLELKAHLDVLESFKQRIGGGQDQRQTIRDEILSQVLEIIQPYLEPSAFAKVRKLLRDKIR